ncbi:hypothetical protein [Phytohabitans houttuyneae]|uniref:hypothetical protein n=1 Tax=Phytohabitans houttuyneae TaxID=1076126 RepID=UPI001565D7AB|nr:hypothetical protein [Phytohabitans houttuyneae]
MSRLRAALVLLLTTSSLVLVAVSPASAAPTLALDVGSVTLVANGAAVRVQITATCFEGDVGGITPTVTQAAGDRVAQGTQAQSFTCTGQPQQFSILVLANVNGAPFRTGVALVTTQLQSCPGANCTTIQTDEVVRIRR